MKCSYGPMPNNNTVWVRCASSWGLMEAGGGGGCVWSRRSGRVSVCVWRLCGRTEQQQSRYTDDPLSHPEEHTGMMVDGTLCVTVELISEQFTLQH